MIRRTTFRPQIETLEQRTVLAAGLSAGILTVSGGAGADTIVVSQSGTNVLVTYNSVNSLFPLSQINSVRINGAGGADTITYTLDKQITITGGDGNNTITSSGIDGGGTATIIGGSGNDTITCNDAGRATISGNAGDDTMTGGNLRTATIFGSTGDDSITCTASQSAVIYGDGGNDTILSNGTGSTTIFGGANNDGLTGGFGYNKIDGGSGADTIKGRGTWNRLRGGEGADTFTQQGGPARLFVDRLDSFTLRSNDTVDFEPVLTFSGTVGYVHDSPAFTLVPFAVVTDVDNANFAQGNLHVRMAQVSSSNRLAIRSGSGFTVDANNNVLFGTTIIGQRTANGFGANALHIAFKTTATKAIVQQLVRAITFQTVGGAASQRQVVFTVADGVGGVSAEARKSVSIS